MFTQRVLTSLVLSGLLILAAGATAVDAAVLTLDACTPEALRALIAGAVAGDVLLLPACTIFVAGASGDDANASGDFDIATSITLQGVGPDATILDGGGLDRVLDIRPGATVVVADLTVRNGAAALVDEDGGGIRNEGTATIINVVITGNTADDDGGGIYNLGTLTVTGSVISNNFAGDDGGGIRSFNAGAVAVLDGSRVVGNSCGDSGGGVDNDSGTMTIRESTTAPLAEAGGRPVRRSQGASGAEDAAPARGTALVMTQPPARAGDRVGEQPLAVRGPCRRRRARTPCPSRPTGSVRRAVEHLHVEGEPLPGLPRAVAVHRTDPWSGPTGMWPWTRLRHALLGDGLSPVRDLGPGRSRHRLPSCSRRGGRQRKRR